MTLTFRRARLLPGSEPAMPRLVILLDSDAAPDGILTVDRSKITITGTAGDIGFAADDTTYPVTGAIPGATAVRTPTYGSVDIGVTTQAKLTILLNRAVAHDEPLLLNMEAGALSDDSASSVAIVDQPVQVRTFTDADGEFVPPARVGAGSTRIRLDPSTLSPVVQIAASNASSVGDGNTVSSFAATAGGTVSVTGTVTYRANYTGKGTTGTPTLEMASGSVLTTTATLSSSTAPFTVFLVYANTGGVSPALTVAGAHCVAGRTAAGSNNQKRWNSVAGDSSFGSMGGRYDLSPWTRMEVQACSYSHADTRVRAYGHGGVFIATAVHTTIVDHSVAITITAGAGTQQIAAIIIVEGELTQQQVRQIGADLDEAHNITNLIYYVDITGGNDANSGLTSAAPRLTPPDSTSSSYDGVTYGAGDCVLFLNTNDHIDMGISNRAAMGNVPYGYSSEYPNYYGFYGTRSAGRAMFRLRTSTTHNIGNHESQPYTVICGIGLVNEARIPGGPHWVGYSAALSRGGNGFRMGLEDTPIAAEFLDADDPPFHGLFDVESSYAADKGITDGSPTTFTGERWFHIERSLVTNQWYGLSLIDTTGARPSGAFINNCTVFSVCGCVFYRNGWNPKVASIGDWDTSDNRIWSNECVATYDAGTDTTSVVLAAEFALQPWHVNVKGPVLVTCARTSDGTEIPANIVNKDSDDEITIAGNPYGLADTASVSDAILHGGLPAGGNGLCHARYLDNNTLQALLDNYHNWAIDPADHGDQQRPGGLCWENGYVDCAIAGFVGGLYVAEIQGCMVWGGKSTQGHDDTGPRAWGFAINNGSSGPTAGTVRECIFSTTAFGPDSDFVPTVSGTTQVITLNGTTGVTLLVIAENNTILRGASRFINGDTGASLNAANCTIRRNIIQQPTTDPDAVVETDLIRADLVDCLLSYNIWWHPDGGTALRWNSRTQSYTDYVTTSGETGGQVLEVTYTGGNDPDPWEYYATLPGGTDDKADWIDALLAASRAGDLGDLGVRPTGIWIRGRLQPGNLTSSDGGGVIPGAAALASEPATAPTVTDPTSDSIASTSATLGGNVTSNGGSTVTERGITIALTSVNADPEIGGTGVTKLTTTGTTGVFTLPATGLTAASGYSFKAFATNGEGTGYSDADTFTTAAGATLVVTTPTEGVIPDPVSLSTTLFVPRIYRIRLFADGGAISGISIPGSGVAHPIGLIPLSIPANQARYVDIELRAGTEGEDQAGQVTVTWTGGGPIEVNFLLTVGAHVAIPPRSRTRERVR